MLINVKMPTIVGIFTFMSMVNTISESLKAKTALLLFFVVSTVSLSLSHWYPGSGVVLDCIDS